MGVTGLWKLIEASGKPVPLETLENKVLAIDISIWLHQVVKGYQDSKGGNLPNAHLLGLFNRICKLLFFRIKPVFVFDGGVPELKRQTIAKRAQQKNKIQNEADRLEKLLIESLAREKIVKQALGDPEKLNLSPSKLSKNSKKEERDDMFKLPPVKEELANVVKTEIDDEEDDDDFCPKRSYDVNINKIDVTSSQFKSLPADIRHDILTDIKETRKQNSWARLRELPVESDDFSGYQMSRLLRRRQVQLGIEAAEQEMGGKTWSLSELEAMLSEDGVLEMNDKHCQKIASDENTRFLLVRDIAKAMNEAKKQDVPSTSQASIPQPSTSKQSETLDAEEELDLQRAIQLSLEENESEEKETDGKVKLNQEQRQKFGSTIQTHGLIRGFMMEYAEMNDADIQDLMEATQVDDDCLNDSFKKKFPKIDDYVLYGTPKKNFEAKEDEENISKTQEVTILSDAEESGVKADKLVITVEADLKNYKKEEDLFADIFEKTSVVQEIPDVEVASISSDDDTLPYEVAPEKIEELDEIIAANEETGVESEAVDEVSANVSENEKFWSEAETIEEKIAEPITNETNIEDDTNIPDISENEKFYADDDDEIILIPKEIEAKLKTPEREKSPLPAKVPSPFFVNRKTPTSKTKENSEEKKAPNSIFIAKNLFPAQNAIQQAVDELKNQNTSEELQQMKIDLVDQQRNLLQERNKQDRMGTSITESMSRDCKDLLKLFGIPYIDSPMEAEAQCAFLNMISLTDGTISDDSDIWLFGGQTVYKNFFVQKKIVMEFSHENIGEMFHLDRNKLIQLAMLVGSDYTVGVNGIGAVTALEILAAFPPTEVEGGTNEYQSLVSSLRKFRDWFHGGKTVGPGGKTVLKSKLKNVELFEGFPNINVARAYLEPIVDTNTDPFTWGLPDTESLVEYAKDKLGWTRLKTEEILAPVMKKLNEKKQSTIKDFFKSQVTKKFFDSGKMSKRVQKAVGKMAGKEDEVEKAPKKASKRKAPKSKAAEEENLDDLIFLSSDEEFGAPSNKKSSPEHKAGEASTSRTVDAPKVSSIKPKANEKAKPKTAQRKRKTPSDEPSTSTAALSTIDVKKRAPRIPNTKQIIPQREKEKEDQQKAKDKAIELFKKSKKK